MSIPISFDFNKVDCQASLVEGKKGGLMINIAGKDFTVIKGEKMDEKLEKVLQQIVGGKFKSILDLEDQIGKIEGCSNVIVGDKSYQFGVEALLGKSPKGLWMQQEQKALPAFRKEVAECYWNKHVSGSIGDKKDHGMLKSNLVKPSLNKEKISSDFDKAIQTQDKKLFCSCFEHLEFYQLYPIVNGEGLDEIKLPEEKLEPVDLTQEGLKDHIKCYLKDRGFSGIVALSDGKNDLLVASDEFNEVSTPLSIHSVGKIFTGMLALCLIEEGIFDEEDLEKPIQLDPSVMKALPPHVQDRLAQTTFKDVMLHLSGVKDYLKNYQDDIQHNLNLGKQPPIITSCEDLLNYAENDVVELEQGKTHLDEDKSHYSNLGLLLVGLSLQYLVSKKKKESISFEKALDEYVLKPAGVEVYTPMKPEKAQYNLEDPMAAYLYGGPGGGHWSTAPDLLKLGKWIGRRSKEDGFGELLKKHGGEFYGNGMLWHAGSISSASSHLTHLGNQGLTVAVLSNTKGFCQATAVAETIQDHLIL